MSETAHPEPNYMGVFWWLLALTIIEVAVIYLPIAKLAIAIMLINGGNQSRAGRPHFMHLVRAPHLGARRGGSFVLCVF